MSNIDLTALRTADAGRISLGASPVDRWAAALVAERVARGQAEDRTFGLGLLILPALVGMIVTGWLLPVLALLYAAVPAMALLLCVIDACRPRNPTEVWHGR